MGRGRGGARRTDGGGGSDGFKGGAASADGQHSANAAAPHRTPAHTGPADTVNNAFDVHRPPVLNTPSFSSGSVSLSRATMWLLILAYTFLDIALAAQTAAGNVTVTFPKCCANGQSLMRLIDVFSDEQYKCLSREFTERNFSVVVPPLVLGENVEVRYGPPENCTDLVMAETEDEILIAENHCYDRLVLDVVNGSLRQNIPRLVSLSCASHLKKTRPVIELNYLRKCCPRGQSYDTQYHDCLDADEENSEEWLVKRFIDPRGGSVYEVDYNLHCKYDEYAVELIEDRFSLVVEGSTLKASRIGESEEISLLRGEWCVDQQYGTKGLVVRGCTKDCSSFGAFCLRKCCEIGSHYKPFKCGSTKSKCVPNTDLDTKWNVSYYLDPLRNIPEHNDEVIGLRFELQCAKGKFVLRQDTIEDAHHLTASGRMMRPEILGGITDDYCFENFDRRDCGQDPIVQVLVCYEELVPKNKNFSLSFVTLTISCVFLFLTLVVYCALPELRNLHGKTLICHVSTMLLAFSCLARAQYGRVDDNNVCKTLGYCIYFGFVAAFSWLNVMCLDIWWTFGSVRTIQPLRKAGAERRRFAWYSLYAWSSAILLTLTMLLLDLYPVVKVLNAHIGRDICWFGSLQNTETDWPHYIFFVIPVGIVVCVNFVLWALTARHCHRVKSEVHRLQAGSAGDRAKMRFRADQARYVLTGKLWVVMGASWFWELLSTLVTEPVWLWSIFDLINELQGVSIFVILVMKPKLYYLIRKRLGMEKPDARKNGTSSTARTSSTFLSRNISTEEHAQQRISLPNNNKTKD